jgi:hypothetical protein
MSNLDKPFIITVCKDGSLSILERGSKGQRRLGAALPVYGCDDVLIALELIRRVGWLRRVDHGPKLGIIIEPLAPNWNGELEDIEKLGEVLKKEEEKWHGAVAHELRSKGL